MICQQIIGEEEEIFYKIVCWQYLVRVIVSTCNPYQDGEEGPLFS